LISHRLLGIIPSAFLAEGKFVYATGHVPRYHCRAASDQTDPSNPTDRSDQARHDPQLVPSRCCRRPKVQPGHECKHGFQKLATFSQVCDISAKKTRPR
jgi:hypothetical protein